jgi:hypothetical protein
VVHGNVRPLDAADHLSTISTVTRLAWTWQGGTTPLKRGRGRVAVRKSSWIEVAKKTATLASLVVVRLEVRIIGVRGSELS